MIPHEYFFLVVEDPKEVFEFYLFKNYHKEG